MRSVIEHLESRQYCSTSLSGATVLDLQASEAVLVDQVNNFDKDDTYVIRVMKAGEINLRLEGLTGDASLELVSDKNRNNRADSGETIVRSNKLGGASEVIRKQVAPGTYHVRVVQFEGNALINYTLRYSNQAITTPDQVDKTGNTLSDAREFSVPKGGNRTVNEYIGNGDDSDVYRFSLTETVKTDIRLNGLTKDADVILTDANGTVIATTAGKSRTAKIISGKLTAGTYYIVVKAGSSAPTGYALRAVNSAYRSSDLDLNAKKPSLATSVFSAKLIETR